MEVAGAVFLPGSGGRGGSGVDYVQNYGSYWSATPNDTDDASYLYFGSYGTDDGDLDRNDGQAVRLVQDL